MNAISQSRRLELSEREYHRDDREPWEVLPALVEAHLANVDRLDAIAKSQDIDAGEFREAEKRYLRSQADLYCAIEDAFCVPAEKLGRAINA